MIHVRRCTDKDMYQVLRLARKMHAESPLHSLYPFSVEKVTHLVESARASADWLAVVVVKDMILIGFALVAKTPMYFSDSDEVVDLAIYIAPDSRGGRAALLLIKFIEHWAQHLGVARIAFGIHTGINHDQALSFFVKMGYVPEGIQITKSVH